MLDKIVYSAPVFVLVFARCIALIMTLPLFSARSISRMAKIALGLYMAYFIFPQVSLAQGTFSSYAPFITKEGNFNVDFLFLVAGEAIIGIIIGLFIQIIFAAFSTAGQFFAFQMGLSASEVYDAMSQVENPLMGQYFNLIAMLIFLQNAWFQRIFVGALSSSFQAINAFAIVEHSDALLSFMLSSLSLLFKDSLVIALPLMGTLFLINVTMGILGKAAPQMNLLSEGFPILILTAFFLITILMPQLCDFFVDSFAQGFKQIERLLTELSGGGI